MRARVLLTNEGSGVLANAIVIRCERLGGGSRSMDAVARKLYFEVANVVISAIVPVGTWDG